MASSSLQNAKKLLRKEMKQILNALTEESKASQSAAVTRKLLSDEVYKSAKSLSVFLSMPDEVRTNSILRDALEAGKRCYVPRYFADGGGHEMEERRGGGREPHNEVGRLGYDAVYPSSRQYQANNDTRYC